MEHVFVYGSLMKGFWNHRYLEEQKFKGCGELQGYEMYHVSTFPGIIYKPGERIVGEVYLIEDHVLKTLDRLEGEGVMYVRRKEKVTVQDNIIEAYIYVWNRRIDSGYEKVVEMPWKPKGRKYK